MEETFLVIGGNSRVGREVVDQLTHAGHRVHALVRADARVDALRHNHATLFNGDLGNASSLKPAFAGVSRAYVATNDDESSVPAFARFLEAAREADCGNCQLFQPASSLRAW